MKRIVATTLAVLSFSMAAQAAEQTITIAVGKLSCPSCAYIVSNAMQQVPTVAIVAFVQDEVNTLQGTFTVTYDDATATPEMIIEAIKGYGYPATIASAGDT